MGLLAKTGADRASVKTGAGMAPEPGTTLQQTPEEGRRHHIDIFRYLVYESQRSIQQVVLAK